MAININTSFYTSIYFYCKVNTFISNLVVFWKINLVDSSLDHILKNRIWDDNEKKTFKNILLKLEINNSKRKYLKITLIF